MAQPPPEAPARAPAHSGDDDEGLSGRHGRGAEGMAQPPPEAPARDPAPLQLLFAIGAIGSGYFVQDRANHDDEN